MKRLSGIRTVSFDMDETFRDLKEVMRRSLSHTLKELEDINPEAARKLDVEKMMRQETELPRSSRGKPSTSNRSALKPLGGLREVGIEDEDLAAHLIRIYFEHRYEDIEPVENVLPTLSILGKKYRL